jgi:hypothetical protein
MKEARVLPNRARNRDFTTLSRIGPSRNYPLAEEIEELSGRSNPRADFRIADLGSEGVGITEQPHVHDILAFFLVICWN